MRPDRDSAPGAHLRFGRTSIPTLVGFQGGCGRRCAVSPWRPSPSRCLARIWAAFLNIYMNCLKHYKYGYEDPERGIAARERGKCIQHCIAQLRGHACYHACYIYIAMLGMCTPAAASSAAGCSPVQQLAAFVDCSPRPQRGGGCQRRRLPAAGGQQLTAGAQRHERAASRV